jgi:NADPH2:quinone reductase
MQMVKAVRVYETGGPEVMKIEDITLPPPGPGEALVRHTAIGLNFIDIYFRTGLYKTALPYTPGVEAVGPGVTDVAVGDRVAYCQGANAYAEAAVISSDKLFRLPDGVDDATAAGMMLKGLTAWYLLRRTFRVEPHHTVLFHAAAGGVGLIAGQWARHIGCTIIGTVGSEEKAALARANGYTHVVNYRTEDFPARVLEITGGRKCDVVYDSVGKDTFMASLDCLRPLGMMVLFGQASGPVPPFDPNILNAKGSLFLTRPRLGSYAPTAAAYREAAGELADLVARGIVRIAVNQRFALGDVVEAHKALAGRSTTGSTVVIP